jgi:enoyl-CoA hydratase/carnithine racemase
LRDQDSGVGRLFICIPRWFFSGRSRRNGQPDEVEISVNEVVKLERHDFIGIVTVSSPPVNALNAAAHGGIIECIKSAVADPEIKAIVLTCAGRTFIAGADITEFGKPPKSNC